MAVQKYDLKTILTILVPLLLGAGGIETAHRISSSDCDPSTKVQSIEMRLDTLASKNDLDKLNKKIDSAFSESWKRAVIDSIGSHQLGEKVDTMMARINKISAVVNQMNHVDKYGLACDASVNNGTLARR